MNIFNTNLCHSVKNKLKKNEQCCNKQKPNEIFCGVHLNSKNLILFDSNMYENISAYIPNIPNFPINQLYINVLADNIFEDEKKEIFGKEELFQKILSNIYISVYSLRQSIKNCELNNLINTKQSKSSLISDLKKIISRERYYTSNQLSIILIQSIFRRWTVYRKKICSNDTDILTFSSKYDIPDTYFYMFNDKISGRKYAYDIRTLYEIINSDYPSCPYTFRPFSEIEKNQIILYRNKLIGNSINVNIVTQKLTHEEELEMKIKDVFYQINMLDNYTNHMWFKNLSLIQLIELYIKAEDIWKYRSEMDIESKKKIINTGIAFNIPINIIKNLKSKDKLQHLILDEFKRFISEGINRDEKKLGAILILTALVEVSHEASLALPHLVQ